MAKKKSKKSQDDYFLRSQVPSTRAYLEGKLDPSRPFSHAGFDWKSAMNGPVIPGSSALTHAEQVRELKKKEQSLKQFPRPNLWANVPLYIPSTLSSERRARAIKAFHTRFRKAPGASLWFTLKLKVIIKWRKLMRFVRG